jgi:signal transduction histidine kinase
VVLYFEKYAYILKLELSMSEKMPDGDVRPDNLDLMKLSKLGMLVGGISHNLYGPLTGIIGILDILKMKHPDIKDDLDKVSRLSYRLKEDIRVMLYKAKIEGSGEIAEIDLGELIRNEFEFYKADPRMKHYAEVTINIQEDLPRFFGPISDFCQSFSNIITNSAEAIMESDEKRVNVDVTHDADNIYASFADTGCGMDEETLSHIYDPFVSTKTPSESGQYPSTLAYGIGMTHVKNMLEHMDVEIDIQSSVGDGTNIKFTIPYQKINEVWKAKMGATPGGGLFT